MKTNQIKILMIALFFGVSFVSWSQTINTVAGDSAQGFSGDQGPATAAEFSGPAKVTLDASGNFYIADIGNSRFRKVNTSGIISTFAGNGVQSYSGDGGQATAAEFNFAFPPGLTMDASGNLYIGDDGNYRIRIMNTSGIVSTFAGNGIQGFSGDGGQATAAELGIIEGVALDASGNIYVADIYYNRIRKVNTSGIINTIAGNGYTNFFGQGGYSGDGGPATAAELNYPADITMDASGNLYIADNSNNRIRIVNTSGIINTFAGDSTRGYSGDGGQATAAELYAPRSVALDASGNVYIADMGNNRIRIVNTSGIISTFAGNGYGSPSGGGYSGDGGNAIAAELYNPDCITVNASGDVYIADWSNNRVRKVTSKSAGINDISSSFNEITVYPTPTTGSFTVSGITQGQIIELYNYMGQKVEMQNFASLQTTLHFDISSLANGIYLVRIRNKDGSVVAQKKMVKIN